MCHSEGPTVIRMAELKSIFGGLQVHMDLQGISKNPGHTSGPIVLHVPLASGFALGSQSLMGKSITIYLGREEISLCTSFLCKIHRLCNVIDLSFSICLGTLLTWLQLYVITVDCGGTPISDQVYAFTFDHLFDCNPRDYQVWTRVLVWAGGVCSYVVTVGCRWKFSERACPFLACV
jgi:hypothetical protein